MIFIWNRDAGNFRFSRTPNNLISPHFPHLVYIFHLRISCEQQEGRGFEK
jgi:hypothetical protein